MSNDYKSKHIEMNVINGKRLGYLTYVSADDIQNILPGACIKEVISEEISLVISSEYLADNLRRITFIDQLGNVKRSINIWKSIHITIS